MRQSRFLDRLFDRNAAKRTVSLTINADLVAKAKEAGLNLSQISEEALAAAVTAYWRERIKAEIAEDMKAYDAHIAEHGSFADAMREYLTEQEGQDAV
jgi:post-segregation antitoxin (ccd killing protein)